MTQSSASSAGAMHKTRRTCKHVVCDRATHLRDAAQRLKVAEDRALHFGLEAGVMKLRAWGLGATIR